MIKFILTDYSSKPKTLLQKKFMNINSKNCENFNKLENVLIIGNGGRENALAWAIEKNESIKKIFLSPGNAGSRKINKSSRITLDLVDIKQKTFHIIPIHIILF